MPSAPVKDPELLLWLWDVDRVVVVPLRKSGLSVVRTLVRSLLREP
jgi:hypothetical protein